VQAGGANHPAGLLRCDYLTGILSLAAIFPGVMFTGLFSMMRCPKVMSIRQVCMVRAPLLVPGLVVLGRLAVVCGGQFMILRRQKVVFCASMYGVRCRIDPHCTCSRSVIVSVAIKRDQAAASNRQESEPKVSRRPPADRDLRRKLLATEAQLDRIPRQPEHTRAT
jgi:hypothetical protein